jgi:PAS domain S-box-containing protein
MMIEPLLVALALVVATAVLVTALRRGRRGSYRSTLEGLPVGLCTIGEDGAIRLWNPEMARVSGISAANASGAHFRKLPEPWSSAFRDALDKASDDVIKRSLPDSGAGARWVILHSSPPSGGERTVLIEDISDYQRLQDDVLHRERLASIGRLAAGVAHEIGNPVTGIACVAQNLMDPNCADDTVAGAEEILKQTDRISKIVESLVQFSHSGGNSRAVGCVPCNLADCVDEAIHLLSLDREAGGAGFSNHCHRELLVLADNQLLLQVFVNLLENARSAAPAGSSIDISAASDEATVVAWVDNQGPPVDAETLARVFEPFYTTKDVGHGTGLGLPLVRGMLEDMGGEIELLSPCPGRADGARARLRRPRAQSDRSVLG